MKKILLIDDANAFALGIAKLLKRRGFEAETASTVAEAKQLIEKEMPLLICSDLDLPDGSGLELLDMVRAIDTDLPVLIMSCYDKDYYEKDALRRGATLCLDKMKTNLLQDKLIEYAYRQSFGEQSLTFHKLLFVNEDDASARVFQAGMMKKGFNVVVRETLASAKDRLLEDTDIEAVLCNLSLPDGTALDLFHDLQDLSEMFQGVVKLLPFFILTDNDDLATEYQYRHDGVSDYFVYPINVSELIRRIRYFVENS